jgi:hypothetical protein
MIGSQIRAEFASRGRALGSSIVFDEHVAMALIRRAQEEGIAVVDVEQLRPGDFNDYAPSHARGLGHLERPSSWRQASAFVESLSSRGLYFNLTLEPWWATWLARIRWHMTQGPAG